jgi:hypothetical protein
MTSGILVRRLNNVRHAHFLTKTSVGPPPRQREHRPVRESEAFDGSGRDLPAFVFIFQPSRDEHSICQPSLTALRFFRSFRPPEFHRFTHIYNGRHRNKIGRIY